MNKSGLKLKPLKWNEMKESGVGIKSSLKWNQVKWNKEETEVKWNEVKEVKWSETEQGKSKVKGTGKL